MLCRNCLLFLSRVGRVIKTCRIQVEGRLYTIDSKEFESLVDLVSYYERNPLYHRVKLRKPVSAEVLRRNGTVSKYTLFCILFGLVLFNNF